jgi:hypothetical protein
MLRAIALALRARLRETRWLRNFLLIAQPPLLCEEGNIAADPATKSAIFIFNHGHAHGLISRNPHSSRRRLTKEDHIAMTAATVGAKRR